MAITNVWIELVIERFVKMCSGDLHNTATMGIIRLTSAWITVGKFGTDMRQLMSMWALLAKQFQHVITLPDYLTQILGWKLHLEISICV